MKPLLAALIVLTVVAIAAAPASASALDSDDARINCTGSPTSVPKVDSYYRLGCALVGLACDLLFSPCPIA